jgi:prepilin-type N-terminal cleavage/methylation domain-containing protein
MARATTYAISGASLSLRIRTRKANPRFGKGLTLIEMLVVVAVILILAGIVISLTWRVDNQAKERALKNTFGLLKSALTEYYDFTDTFPLQPNPTDPNSDDAL